MNFTSSSAQVVSFLAGCQALVDANSATFSELSKIQRERLVLTEGGRYIKIVRETLHLPTGTVNSRSAHCFIDRTNGDVLKTASWAAPAKGARGNIADDKNGLGRMGCYGAGYNR
jgi:hypothetical protein